MSISGADLASGDLASGKGHRDENFPVASWLLRADARAPVLAFYAFAREADDVADNAEASAETRLALLGTMRGALLGESGTNANAAHLGEVLGARGLAPVHALDLIAAFERDCRADRCADWDDLIGYCRLSAMPVGRFVLDVHGESHALWGANDALCAALQVINHLQDCAKDYRALGRVYLPLDVLARHGARVEDLAAPAATPGLRAAIIELAGRCDELLGQARGFAAAIADRRLGLEVAVIHRLAASLVHRLKTRDPLCQRVHHRKHEAAGLAALAIAGRVLRR